jgi:hypothetical protein
MGWIFKSVFRTVLVVLVFVGIFVVSVRSLVTKSPSSPSPTSDFSPATPGVPIHPKEKHSVLPFGHGHGLPKHAGGHSGSGVSSSQAPTPSPEEGQSDNTVSLVSAVVGMLGTLSTIYFAWVDRRDKRREFEQSRLRPPPG